MTTEMLIIVGSICLFATTVGVLIALKIQRNSLVRLHVQQEAWERAQEGHQRQWEDQQTKQLSELENDLSAQVGWIWQEWRIWKENDAAREETLAQHYEGLATQLNLERELARLPRIEDAPVLLNTNGSSQPQHSFPNWRPAMLHGAKLIAYDLSHRYLGRAELRDAHLQGSNFFFSDLSRACLAGADLSGADLSGANLAGADLRGAILTGANLQVADLHKAILTGTNLLGVRNLTIQQIYTAIYDGTTQLDAHLDVTVPGLRRVALIPLPPAPATPVPDAVEDELSEEEEHTPDEDTAHLSAMPKTISEPVFFATTIK